MRLAAGWTAEFDPGIGILFLAATPRLVLESTKLTTLLACTITVVVHRKRRELSFKYAIVCKEAQNDEQTFVYKF